MDKLFRRIVLEVRGHDKAVLLSYTTFLKNACNHLEIKSSDVRHYPYIRWIQWLLRSKFVHKKNKYHYETRTHIKQMDVYNVTSSTASTFLEYVQRNIPEGVAMRVDYEELCALPDTINVDQAKVAKATANEVIKPPEEEPGQFVPGPKYTGPEVRE